MAKPILENKDYQYIVEQLSYAWYDWAVSDGNLEAVVKRLELLDDDTFNRIVQALIDEESGLHFERFYDNALQQDLTTCAPEVRDAYSSKKYFVQVIEMLAEKGELATILKVANFLREGKRRYTLLKVGKIESQAKLIVKLLEDQNASSFNDALKDIFVYSRGRPYFPTPRTHGLFVLFNFFKNHYPDKLGLLIQRTEEALKIIDGEKYHLLRNPALAIFDENAGRNYLQLLKEVKDPTFLLDFTAIRYDRGYNLNGVKAQQYLTIPVIYDVTVLKDLRALAAKHNASDIVDELLRSLIKKIPSLEEKKLPQGASAYIYRDVVKAFEDSRMDDDGLKILKLYYEEIRLLFGGPGNAVRKLVVSGLVNLFK